jgi:hypothetical protein
VNCLVARGEVMANPIRLSPVVAAHLAKCQACRDFAREARALDNALAGALAIPVPSGLAGRLLDECVHRNRQPHLRLALAACIAAVIIAELAATFRADNAAARAGIDFVADDEARMILAAKSPDPEALKKASEVIAVMLPPQIGELRYVGTCAFLGATAHHIVAATPQGKATILLAPGAIIDLAGDASARGLVARVRRSGSGVVAIMANSRHSLERVDQMLRRRP